MAEDSVEEKLRDKGQTDMKHRILRLYLDPWIKKLSSSNSVSKLVFIDGFAGPGIYPDDTTGSPLVVMNKIDRVLSKTAVDGNIDEFKCIFVEDDDDTYEQLERNVTEHEAQVDHRIEPRCIPGEFEEWATEFMGEYKQGHPPPTLIFVDPFGYSGLPFELLSELFQLREKSLELLITFMSGKMAQWMDDPNHQKAITETLGLDHWRQHFDDDMPKDRRAQVFSQLYQAQWRREADANFTFPFEMVEEGKRQTCYYLIHVTNHLDGLKVMKHTMFNAGANDQYAYLGPDHAGYEDDQLSFTDFGSTDNFDQQIRSFGDGLHDRYNGEKMRLEELLRLTLDGNIFKVPDYRSAFEHLSKQDKLRIDGAEYTKGNNTGCEPDSEIEFVDLPTLSDFSDT